MQLTGYKCSRIRDSKHRDVCWNVTTRITRLRGLNTGLQGLPIVTHPRNTISFDRERAERMGRPPCWDSVGEFETLEKEAGKEKRKKRAEIKKWNLSWKKRKEYERQENGTKKIKSDLIETSIIPDNWKYNKERREKQKQKKNTKNRLNKNNDSKKSVTFINYTK